MMKGVSRYDPDEFVLDKEMLIGIINGVKNYWKQHRISNFRLITGMNLFEIWVRSQSDEDIKNIWSLIIKFIDQLRYRNAIQLSENEGSKWGATMKKTESYIDLTNKEGVKKSIWGF